LNLGRSYTEDRWGVTPYGPRFCREVLEALVISTIADRTRSALVFRDWIDAAGRSCGRCQSWHCEGGNGPEFDVVGVCVAVEGETPRTTAGDQCGLYEPRLDTPSGAIFSPRGLRFAQAAPAVARRSAGPRNRWALRGTHSAAQLKTTLKQLVDDGDRIVVTEIGAEWASRRALADLGRL
jgi:hypothetical protein